jgi:hypothetical protein
MMTIEFKSEVPGHSARWEITDPAMTALNVEQLKDRSGLILHAGTQQTKLPKGFPVSITMPPGIWNWSSSTDGTHFKQMPQFTSDGKYGLVYLLDGAVFPAVWSRYTKVIHESK